MSYLSLLGSLGPGRGRERKCENELPHKASFCPVWERKGAVEEDVNKETVEYKVSRKFQVPSKAEEGLFARRRRSVGHKEDYGSDKVAKL